MTVIVWYTNGLVCGGWTYGLAGTSGVGGGAGVSGQSHVVRRGSGLEIGKAFAQRLGDQPGVAVGKIGAADE